MMPLHRRFNAKEEVTKENVNLDDNERHGRKSKSEDQLNGPLKGHRSFFLLGLIALQAMLLIFATTKTNFKSTSHLMTVLLAAGIASLPAFLILGVGLGIFGGAADLPHQRFIPLAVVAAIVGNQLPTFLSSGMAASAMLVFGLSSRPVPQPEDVDGEKQGNQKRSIFYGPLGAVLAVILLSAVLLTENFFIWIVSATYKPGQTFSQLPTPLQDNGQLILLHFFNSVLDLTKREVVTVRNMVNVEWILVSGLGLSLVAIELQGTTMRRNLWSLVLRAIFTLTIARSIRTISFLITVLPSQNPRCYFDHFPIPPPTDWFSWIMVGFIPQANGGCNDLIISGHATVTSTLACVVTSVVGKPLFTTSLWMFVALDYMVEIYEGFHYSVDMWLGAILVNFIWTALAPLEEPTKQEHGVSARKFYPLNETTRSDLLKYALPVAGSYLQVNGFIPLDLANYTIVLYIISVIFQISTSGFQQYTQHFLFCLLYMALGIYL
jgi:hypothetical protein